MCDFGEFWTVIGVSWTMCVRRMVAGSLSSSFCGPIQAHYGRKCVPEFYFWCQFYCHMLGQISGQISSLYASDDDEDVLMTGSAYHPGFQSHEVPDIY